MQAFVNRGSSWARQWWWPLLSLPYLLFFGLGGFMIVWRNLDELSTVDWIVLLTALVLLVGCIAVIVWTAARRRNRA